MIRSAPMAVLSLPASKPLWPRCAAAGILGTASALRPELPARLLLPLRRPVLLSASWASSQAFVPPDSCFLIPRRKCPPVPKPHKVVNLALSPTVILGRKRIDAGIDTNIANKEIRALDKMSYLIKSSPAEATCGSCHRRAPSCWHVQRSYRAHPMSAIFHSNQVPRGAMCQFRTSRRELDGLIVTIVGTDARLGPN
jgi:hypothetical protein